MWHVYICMEIWVCYKDCILIFGIDLCGCWQRWCVLRIVDRCVALCENVKTNREGGENCDVSIWHTRKCCWPGCFPELQTSAAVWILRWLQFPIQSHPIPISAMYGRCVPTMFFVIWGLKFEYVGKVYFIIYLHGWCEGRLAQAAAWREVNVECGREDLIVARFQCGFFSLVTFRDLWRYIKKWWCNNLSKKRKNKAKLINSANRNWMKLEKILINNEIWGSTLFADTPI